MEQNLTKKKQKNVHHNLNFSENDTRKKYVLATVVDLKKTSNTSSQFSTQWVSDKVRTLAKIEAVVNII